MKPLEDKIYKKHLKEINKSYDNVWKRLKTWAEHTHLLRQIKAKEKIEDCVCSKCGESVLYESTMCGQCSQ